MPKLNYHQELLIKAISQHTPQLSTTTPIVQPNETIELQIENCASNVRYSIIEKCDDSETIVVGLTNCNNTISPIHYINAPNYSGMFHMP